MSAPIYILTRRIGRKLYGVAGTSCGGCLAASETVFSFCEAGKPGDEVAWHTVELQKNYKGRLPDYREVSCTERERAIHWHRQTASAPHYPTFPRYCETFDDAAQYEAELADIFDKKGAQP